MWFITVSTISTQPQPLSPPPSPVLDTCLHPVLFVLLHEKSGNRFDLKGSTKDEERLIITGHSDKEDFVKALSGYLTYMQ